MGKMGGCCQSPPFAPLSCARAQPYKESKLGFLSGGKERQREKEREKRGRGKKKGESEKEKEGGYMVMGF
jgi:hypothetical protein